MSILSRSGSGPVASLLVARRRRQLRDLERRAAWVEQARSTPTVRECLAERRAACEAPRRRTG